mgnify:CR=1 FL=1
MFKGTLHQQISEEILKKIVMKTRIYFLDNLRTFLIFLVVVLHAGLVYESVLENTWIVCDPMKNNSIGLIRMYLDLFVMFIIFFISGYFVPYSVKNKSSLDFLKTKFIRIFVPWIIAVFTLIPAYKAIFLFSRGLPQEEWFTYFHLFKRAGTDLSFFANNPSQNWLWFLPVLFIFQVIYLILYKTNLLSIKISLKTGVVLVFIIGVIYSMIISVIGLKGWTLSPLLDFQNERLLVYFLAFLLGSLCNKLNVFESQKKNKKLYIISNVVLTFSLTGFTIVALNLFYNLVDVNRNYYFISEHADRLAYYILSMLAMLSFLHIFIYAFQFSLNKNFKIMEHLNKNSYQVYIIHIIVLGILALSLVNIQIPVYVKYLILTILTFIVSNIIVYAYKSIFQKTISMKLASTVFVLATILSIVVFAKQADYRQGGQSAGWQSTQYNINIDLHQAALQGNIEVVRQNILAGSDLNKKEPDGGGSPLSTAATFGKTEVARALIEAGAEINFVKNDGATPLHVAAFFCHTEMVKLLLEKGADKSILDNNGSTALESLLIPFEDVKGIYEYFAGILDPLGLDLDLEKIKTKRPIIAEMLRNSTSE